jgi:hypothetical protein
VASYQIMYWQDIPRQIKVNDETGTVKRFLPDRFQQAINSAAIAASKVDPDAYMNGWQWGPKEERIGPANEVAEALVAELDAAYPQERLRALIMTHIRKI